MRNGVVLASLLLLCGLGRSDSTEETREVSVDLRATAPSGEARLGYSKPRQFALEKTAPRFLFEIPEFRAEDPIFFRVALGETEGIPFYGALDRTAGGLYHDLLYLDRNRDLDLTNDGDPVPARVRTLWTAEAKLVEFLDITLELPYRKEGEELKEPYSCVFYYVLEEKGGPKVPTSLLMERDGWRQGTFELEGRAYVLALVDDDSDGQFSTSDSWVLRPAGTEPKEMLHRDAMRSMLFPSWSGDQKWTLEVKGVEPSGRTAWLRVRLSKETEQDYFARILRERQSPEERQLNIDPLRPKADDGETVDWLEGKDVAYALEIAANPRVKKPVLLDFTAPTCRWCAMMYKHTFTDREVQQLTGRFVCAKIAFAEGSADVARYHVEGTPTYVILNPDGSEITRHAGFQRPSEFAAWLKSALR